VDFDVAGPHAPSMLHAALTSSGIMLRWMMTEASTPAPSAKPWISSKKCCGERVEEGVDGVETTASNAVCLLKKVNAKSAAQHLPVVCTAVWP
jgi:hypothetical protein